MNSLRVLTESDAQKTVEEGTLMESVVSQDQRTAEEFLDHGTWFRTPKCFFPSCGWPSVVKRNGHYLECRSFARNPTNVMLGMCDLVGAGTIAFVIWGTVGLYDIQIHSRWIRSEVEIVLLPMGILIPWFMLASMVVGRLYWSLRTVPRQKWTVVRFLRHEQLVAVNHAWPVGSELAQAGRERIYRWDQLNPIFRRDLSDAHLPALGVLVMDGTKAVDYLEFGLGIENPGTAREQWEFLRRYMTFDTAPLPATRRVPWYTSPLTAWQQTVDHLTLLAYPEVRSEAIVLWTRLVSAVFHFVADMVRWQPVWSKQVLVLSGQKPWLAYTRAVLQTLTGWVVFAGLSFVVWWLVQRL